MIEHFSIDHHKFCLSQLSLIGGKSIIVVHHRLLGDRSSSSWQGGVATRLDVTVPGRLQALVHVTEANILLVC